MGEFQYRILGNIEVLHRENRIHIEAPRQRAVLASLLLESNRVVSIDRLTRQLWGYTSPPQARNTIQSLILRLRRLLGPNHAGRRHNVLVTRPPGYLLEVDTEQLDLQMFQRWATEGGALLAAGEPAAASRAYRRALELWRGDPLSGAAGAGLQEIEVPALQERRLHAIEQRIECDLQLGLQDSVIPELLTLVAENPLRERPHGQLMLALYRAGRQAEALEIFFDLRRRLVDELALEPVIKLQTLHRHILAQNPELSHTLAGAW